MLSKKMIKKLVLIMSAIALTACTTTPDAPPVVEEMPVDNSPVVETITEPMMSAEERMRMQSEEMRSDRTIYFEFDETTVQQQYLAILEVHAKFLLESGRKVTLEGHADERGTQAYNLALGERRAEAVAQYLKSYGLSSSQIDVVSYGEERPADAGHMDASWTKNRRVEISYR